MENVEKYISKHTKTYCNEVVDIKREEGRLFTTKRFEQWLTTDEARYAARIARKETVDDIIAWMKRNLGRYAEYDHIDEYIQFDKRLYKVLRKDMEDKV